MTGIYTNPEVERAYKEYQEFIAKEDNKGFNALAYWMASRGLLEVWLDELQAGRQQ